MWLVTAVAVVGFLVVVHVYRSPRCASCGCRGELRRGHYSRAYNDLCRQAAGEGGYYCMKCGTIHFDTPNFDEWMARQPKWIVPYRLARTNNGRHRQGGQTHGAEA